MVSSASKSSYWQASRIILATDGDLPGQALAEELARRIGKERFTPVYWSFCIYQFYWSISEYILFPRLYELLTFLFSIKHNNIFPLFYYIVFVKCFRMGSFIFIMFCCCHCLCHFDYPFLLSVLLVFKGFVINVGLFPLLFVFLREISTLQLEVG